jgi:AraC-like DNA-binding protein
MINYYATEFISDGGSLGVLDRSVLLRDDEHTHSFYDILIITGGAGREIIDSKIYEIKPGALFFIDRSVPHRTEPSGEVRYTEIILTPDFFEKPENENELRRIFYTDSDYQPSLTLTEEEQAILSGLVRYLARENERRSGDYRTILRLYVSLVAQYLSRAVERSRSELANRDPDYIISVALEYVDKHFTENISQEELAERFRYNSAYFSRMFKKHMGENLMDYITRKRIDLAAELLEKTDLTAEQISEKVGYKSKPQFYNTFIKYKNKTPRQYRLDTKNK